MSGFWITWTVLLVIAVGALVLVGVGVQRTISTEGWRDGKLHRGAGGRWFWSGIIVALIDGVALILLVLTN
ncbi:hypothetical protein [Bacillus altitudinis]|jgi:hypothetical protein|uniref:hypothetical protein n=1 Tax=Bacillus altitudinis TaxID=293387 RepID=UPI0012F27B37|nr:hypothetical protein [Curtobacterium flaccumfaciens]VXC22775.1 hypothetical protein CURTO8I2_70409 [Curtobacterium sp. 8I-2]VXC29541.1 hypothetical protein BACI9J_710001 [Bacillus altitudinis]